MSFESMYLFPATKEQLEEALDRPLTTEELAIAVDGKILSDVNILTNLFPRNKEGNLILPRSNGRTPFEQYYHDCGPWFYYDGSSSSSYTFFEKAFTKKVPFLDLGWSNKVYISSREDPVVLHIEEAYKWMLRQKNGLRRFDRYQTIFTIHYYAIALRYGFKVRLCY